MRKEPTIAMLAVFSVLLGLNLVAKSSPASKGQVTTEEPGPQSQLNEDTAGPAEPVLVAGDFDDWGNHHIWRFFGDGAVDMHTLSASCDPGDNGPHVVLLPSVPPGGEGPFVVAGRRGSDFIYRYWSDGSVDKTGVTSAADTSWCVPIPTGGRSDFVTGQVIGPAPYAACAPFDSDLDGSVGILDFLAVLANWGPCPG